MGKNTKKGYRIGSVVGREQFYNTSNEMYTKRNMINGQFMANSENKFKGVAEHVDGRRSYNKG